jgi:hypothetical protein
MQYLALSLGDEEGPIRAEHPVELALGSWPMPDCINNASISFAI